MTALEDARRQIDQHILGVMFRGYDRTFGLCETYYWLKAFEAPGLTREIVRGVLRDLTDKGLCAYRRGLFTEDGEPAGAGYGLTPKGVDAYLEMSGQERPQGMGDWWKNETAAQEGRA